MGIINIDFNRNNIGDTNNDEVDPDTIIYSCQTFGLAY